MLICTNCGASLTSKDKFCPKCGYGKENKMNRKEMEEILKAIMTLMKLLLRYVNKPDQEIWSDMIGEVGATIFATNEEY